LSWPLCWLRKSSTSLTSPCGRGIAPKSRGYETVGSQSEAWDNGSSLYRSVPGFFGKEETGLWFDALWPCRVVITQHTSLPTVSILLCSTSSILERSLAYLLAVPALPTLPFLSPPICPHVAGWSTTSISLTWPSEDARCPKDTAAPLEGQSS
jgi:hypothetical protein